FALRRQVYGYLGLHSETVASRSPRALRGGMLRDVAESRDVMPHALEILFVMKPGARGVADVLRRDVPIRGKRQAEIDELLTAVLRVPAEAVDGEAKASMPFHSTRQAVGQSLDFGALVTGIEDKSLDIVGEAQRPVNVGFDVVVERVFRVRLGHRDESHAG